MGRRYKPLKQKWSLQDVDATHHAAAKVSLRLSLFGPTDFLHVDVVVAWYKSVNFGSIETHHAAGKAVLPLVWI